MVRVKAAAQMLAKFLQAVQETIEIGKLRVVQRESQVAQTVQNSAGVVGRQAEGLGGVERIDGHADRDRLAMTQAEPAHGFQPVCRPMAEIQGVWPQRISKGSASARNVFQVQFGRTADDRQAGGQLAGSNRGGRFAQRFEKRRVFQEGHFHRFGKAGQEIAIWQRLEEGPRR